MCIIIMIIIINMIIIIIISCDIGACYLVAIRT